MRGRRLVFNTLVMTATSLGMRSAGLVFQILLSRGMGAAGIGLWGLVMSVYSFAATVAISGIRFCTTRLVSEELGRGRGGNVRRVTKRCTAYASVTGCCAGMLMCIFAGAIGRGFIGDGRTVLSLRVLGSSLPFLAVGAVYSGYFTGVCRLTKSALGAVSEQAFKIIFSLWALRLVPDGDVERMCAAVAGGNAVGEVMSTLVLFIMYRLDMGRYRGLRPAPDDGETRRMLHIAVPLGLSAYARTALNSVQNVLVPRGLKKSGASYETALAGYGTVQGMVMPVITFPQVIFSTLAELIVPELTEEQVRGREDRIKRTADILLRVCLMFSMGVMGALFTFSSRLGMAIYKNGEVGHFIRVMAALMPVMYMDSITDGILRGLGEQLYVMRLNIFDSLICTGLVWVLLPRWALYGYMAILYLSEIVNFAFSMAKLRKTAGVGSLFPQLCRSGLSAVGAWSFASLFEKAVLPPGGRVSLAAGILVYAAVYLAFAAVVEPEGLSLVMQGKRKKLERGI